MGGLKINADAEVLDTQGNVIPGLYAAGETTGGTQSAGPQLFSSTRLCESDICAKENRQCISTPVSYTHLTLPTN